MWHEGKAEMKCPLVFFFFLSNYYIWSYCKETIVIWFDNCAAHNKTRTTLMAIIFESVELKYFVSGHSFMDCGRDLRIIEKRGKVSKSMVPKALEYITKSAQVNTLFQYINTHNLRISKASHIKFTRWKPYIAKFTNPFAFEDPS
ncbi:hypothetical protein PR048_019924 [Dryococelus australis]|uniref:Transposase n=1 Tax=Dryococelus australis TaxID=614101 RepID=A0ABQ9H4U5_9NEOP|nr:hypothetical protein PR048_019924 [Dryococelus australis]